MISSSGSDPILSHSLAITKTMLSLSPLFSSSSSLFLLLSSLFFGPHQHFCQETKGFLISHDIVNTHSKDHILVITSLILGNQKVVCVPKSPCKVNHTLCWIPFRGSSQDLVYYPILWCGCACIKSLSEKH